MSVNMADIIILAVQGILLLLAAWYIARNKKKGKNVCGCGSCSSCSGCPHAAACALPEKKTETGV